MPKPLHVCAEAGCAELTTGAYCDQHARSRTPRAPLPADERPSPSRRGYGYAWQQRRAAFLKEHPWCMAPGCTERATEVDHIVPLRQGGTSEADNLQTLCKRHHSRKTARYDSKRK